MVTPALKYESNWTEKYIFVNHLSRPFIWESVRNFIFSRPNDDSWKLERNALKVDGTSFQVFWICKLWKERTKSQLKVITKFVYDSIAKLVLVWKRQLFCHQLLPWQRYLMIVQTYFWASKAHILKTNLVTPNFFHISFFVIWKWNYMII